MAHYFTKEQIAKANSFNLIDLLRYDGYEIVKSNGGYHLKEHDSLKVSEYNGWNWFSKGIGGKNIDFFMIYENVGFTDAVEKIYKLMNEKVYKTEIEIDNSYKEHKGEPGKFRQPKRNDTNRRAAAYLTQTRGIDGKLVSKLISSGDIYESAKTHNCVFVGKDYNGNVVSTFERGTGSIKYVRDTYGSNKDYRFRITNPASRIVNVFEAEIDLLSYISLFGDSGENYIALGGVSDKALKTFLQENNSDINTINLCLDNDDAGNSACDKLTEIYSLGYKVTREKPLMKDFNEDLKGANEMKKAKGKNYHYFDDIHRIEYQWDLNKAPGPIITCYFQEKMGDRFVNLGQGDKFNTVNDMISYYNINVFVNNPKQEENKSENCIAETSISNKDSKPKGKDNMPSIEDVEEEDDMFSMDEAVEEYRREQEEDFRRIMQGK